MHLSIQHKFAFLCNPKCGSTSVEKAIRQYCNVRLGGHPSIKHITASHFNCHIRPLLHTADPDNQIETFCIMREPFDCLRSWYHYRSRAELANPAHPLHRRYTGNISYPEFVEGFLDGTRQEFAGLGTQATFVSLQDGSLGVNRIFRLDQMDAVADYLSKKIGKKISIPVANKSAPKGSASKSDAFDLPDDLANRLQRYLANDYSIYESLPWNSAAPRSH